MFQTITTGRPAPGSSRRRSRSGPSGSAWFLRCSISSSTRGTRPARGPALHRADLTAVAIRLAVVVLSQSSLHYAFGSRADLLTAALDRYEARIDAELVHPPRGSDCGLRAIDDFFIVLRG